MIKHSILLCATIKLTQCGRTEDCKKYNVRVHHKKCDLKDKHSV